MFVDLSKYLLQDDELEENKQRERTLQQVGGQHHVAGLRK